MSIGAAFAVLNSDILSLDVQPIKFKNWLSLSDDDEKKEKNKLPTKEEMTEIIENSSTEEKLKLLENLKKE